MFGMGVGTSMCLVRLDRRLKARGAAGEEYEKTKTEVMDVLRGHFRPEFLNRIDEIIVFHALGKEEIRHIVSLQLERVARNAARQGVWAALLSTLCPKLLSKDFWISWIGFFLQGNHLMVERYPYNYNAWPGEIWNSAMWT